jgi:hypothetical protein
VGARLVLVGEAAPKQPILVAVAILVMEVQRINEAEEKELVAQQY